MTTNLSNYNTEKTSRRELRAEIEKIKSQLAGYKQKLADSGSERSKTTTVKNLKHIENI